MELDLPDLSLREHGIIVAGGLALALLTFFLARALGRWLAGSTRLGIRGLEGLAAPLTLLIWVGIGWLVLRRSFDLSSDYEWLFELTALSGGFWLASRGLDVLWATAKKSARLRSLPAAKALILASKNLGKVALVVVFVAVIAVRLGATQQLYVILGFIGAALGFAAREPISNLFAFVQLTLDPPFRIGDQVRISDFRRGEPVEGEVVRISLAHVTIRTKRRSEYALTNSMIGELKVENLSSSDRRRLVIELPIRSRIPTERLREACSLIEEDLEKSSWVSQARSPRVWISGYAEGLQLKVSLWLERKADRRDAQRELILQIRSRFEEIVRDGSS